jgi:hypothetical protein
MKPRVFISYASQDQEFVARLEKDLEQNDISIWRDQHRLHVGEDWLKKLQTTLISDITHIIVVISSASMNSFYVGVELGIVRAFNQIIVDESQYKTIIPIKIEPVEIERDFLKQLQTISFEDYGELPSCTCQTFGTRCFAY